MSNLPPCYRQPCVSLPGFFFIRCEAAGGFGQLFGRHRTLPSSRKEQVSASRRIELKSRISVVVNMFFNCYSRSSETRHDP